MKTKKNNIRVTDDIRKKSGASNLAKLAFRGDFKATNPI